MHGKQEDSKSIAQRKGVKEVVFNTPVTPLFALKLFFSFARCEKLLHPEHPIAPTHIILLHFLQHLVSFFFKLFRGISFFA